MDTKDFSIKAAQAAAFLKSLSSPHRLMILCLLEGGELSAGAIEAKLSLKQSALSQHLGRLRKDGLVKTRRDAQTIYYSLADANALLIIQQLQTIYCPVPDKPDK